jgi:hypothetical protein
MVHTGVPDAKAQNRPPSICFGVIAVDIRCYGYWGRRGYAACANLPKSISAYRERYLIGLNENFYIGQLLSSMPTIARCDLIGTHETQSNERRLVLIEARSRGVNRGVSAFWIAFHSVRPWVS